MFGFYSNRERFQELEMELTRCKQAIGNLKKEIKDLKGQVKAMSTHQQSKALNKQSERSA